jgi:hypothetical protein
MEDVQLKAFTATKFNKIFSASNRVTWLNGESTIVSRTISVLVIRHEAVASPGILY